MFVCVYVCVYVMRPAGFREVGNALNQLCAIDAICSHSPRLPYIYEDVLMIVLCGIMGMGGPFGADLNYI